MKSVLGQNIFAKFFFEKRLSFGVSQILLIEIILKFFSEKIHFYSDFKYNKICTWRKRPP